MLFLFYSLHTQPNQSGDDFLTAFKNDADFKLMVKQLKEKINIEPEDDLCTLYNGI